MEVLMNKKFSLKLVSVMLVAMMLVAVFPFTASAANATQIQAASELVTGQYVIVTATTSVAPTVLDGNWVLAESVTVADGAVSATDAAVWTITVDGSTVKLQDSNGKYIAPKGGNNNGVAEGEYAWTVSADGNKFKFLGNGEDTVGFASNMDSENKFRGYKTTTLTGDYADKYPSEFYLFKVDAPAADAGKIVHVNDDNKAFDGNKFWGWIAVSNSELDDYFYVVSGGEKVFGNGAFSHETEEAVVNAAVGAGADYGYRFSAVVPVADYEPGDYTVALYALLKDGSEHKIVEAAFSVEGPVQNATAATELKDGSEYAIYYPDANLVIGNQADGKKLAGVEAAIEGGILSVNYKMAVFTVKLEGDNFYLIADGKYLTSGETGNSLALTDEANDYSLWTLEDAGNGSYYIKSVNAKYKDNAQYLEYYNGFTTYGFNAEKTNIYTFSFYEIEVPAAPETPVEPEETPDTGDSVIYVVITLLAVVGLAVILKKSKVVA